MDRREEIRESMRNGELSRLGGTPRLGDLMLCRWAADPVGNVIRNQRAAYYMEYGRPMSDTELEKLKLELDEQVASKPHLNPLPSSPKRKQPFRKASPGRPRSIASQCRSPSSKRREILTANDLDWSLGSLEDNISYSGLDRAEGLSIDALDSDMVV